MPDEPKKTGVFSGSTMPEEYRQWLNQKWLEAAKSAGLDANSENNAFNTINGDKIRQKLKEMGFTDTEAGVAGHVYYNRERLDSGAEVLQGGVPSWVQEQWWNDVKNARGNLDASAADRKSEADKAAAKAEEDKIRGGITKRVSDFASAMGFTDPNDPTGQLIQRKALSAGRGFAGNAGAGPRSGLGQASVAGMTAQGLQQYDFQRKGLQQQALGLLNNRDVSLGQLDQGWSQLDMQRTNMINQQKEAQWAGQQNAQQGIGSMIGGLGGGILGAYFGGPQGASAGAGAGSSLGGGVAGLFGSSSPNYAPPPKLRGGNGSGF
jgi:hypothetical protein